MDSTTTASVFNVFIAGQIESATFPLGPDAAQIFCRYEIVAGRDWDLMSGVVSGITQSAASKSGKYNDEITFNMPIELTFKSTNPHGWPQMLLNLYGRTRWGAETALGYCRVHLPVFGADQKVTAPILIPKCTNMISEMSNWIAGKNPELKNPSILTDNHKAKGLSTEAYGEMHLKINTITRGTARLGYDWTCSTTQ